MPLTDDTPSARLPRTLDAIEVRVLGCLLEKQQATPDAYPLTLNALVAACNQKTNREPVMDLSAEDVDAALQRLRTDVFVWKSGFSRAEKWEQNVEKKWRLDAPARAVVTLLLLRGAQTPGELRGRSDRLHAFATTGEVEEVLRGLADGPEPLAVELTRRPGQKETRWMHLAGGPVANESAPPDVTTTAPLDAPASRDSLSARIAALEERVSSLARELDELRLRGCAPPPST